MNNETLNRRGSVCECAHCYLPVSSLNKRVCEAHRKQRAEDKKRWKAENPGMAAAYRAKWSLENKDKRVAHYAVQNAIRTGRLVRPAVCESCGMPKSRIEAHHGDYSKPLEVRWLCWSCHKVLHKRLLGVTR